MNNQTKNPAYRIQTERLIIRCWQPDDAPLLKEAVDGSLIHLRPWLPWAHHDPQPLAEKVQLLRTFRGNFDLGQNFVYGIFDLDETKVLGGTGLHPRIGEGALEIGYWIRVDATSRGLATETAAALTKVAFEVHQVDRVEIHCHPKNRRSAAIPHKLGYAYPANIAQQASSDGADVESLIWPLYRKQYPESPAAACQLKAFDVVGTRIL